MEGAASAIPAQPYVNVVKYLIVLYSVPHYPFENTLRLGQVVYAVIQYLVSELAMDKTASIKYSNVPGFFLQDELNTDPTSFDYVKMYAQPYDRATRLIHAYLRQHWTLV